MTKTNPFAFGAARWPGIAKLIEELGETVGVLSYCVWVNDREWWLPEGDLEPPEPKAMGECEAHYQSVGT